MHYLEQTYTEKFLIVYLKFKFLGVLYLIWQLYLSAL